MKACETSVRIIGVQELDPVLYQQWLELYHQTNNGLGSPYFHPQFTIAVSKIRNDARIALFESGKQVLGFLPYQMESASVAAPIAGRLNDFHGVIGSCGSCDAGELLRAMNLNAFAFHAADSEQPLFAPYEFKRLNSPVIDLSKGWDSYLAWFRQNSSIVRRTKQKQNGMRKALGDIEFQWHDTDSETLDWIIHHKSEKYQRTRNVDIFRSESNVKLLHQLHSTNGDGFRSVLSTLRAGGELVSAHFGIAAGKVLHYWFPVYDQQFGKYSPGTQLTYEVCQAATEQGIQKIDLGYGQHSFKQKWANNESKVAIGRMCMTGISASKQLYFIKQWAKKNRAGKLARNLFRSIIPDFGGKSFR